MDNVVSFPRERVFRLIIDNPVRPRRRKLKLVDKNPPRDIYVDLISAAGLDAEVQRRSRFERVDRPSDPAPTKELQDALWEGFRNHYTDDKEDIR